MNNMRPCTFLSYTSMMTIELKLENFTLKKIAIEEKYFDKASKELELLKEVISHNKTHDLENFKTEIKTELENEIVARYYYQKGKLEHSLSLDLEVKKASEILKDGKLYGEILAGKYVDPEIK